ncbi:MAG: hypothetical protein JNL56_14585 [Alphaproteobacteria bacterium]|nr:hypothetical protein [Alphaproteobacteria bacterium]
MTVDAAFDIGAAAQELVRLYGELAAFVADQYAEDAGERGDAAGARRWREVAATVALLLAGPPPGAVTH